MPLKERFGLRSRISVYAVGLILGTVGLVAGALIRQNYRDSIRTMAGQAETYARAISHGAEPAVLLGDREALKRVVQGAGGDPAVEIAQIVDPKGEVLAAYRHHADFSIEAEFDPAHPMAQPGAGDAARVEHTPTQLLVVVPIRKDAPDLDLGIVAEEEAETPEPEPDAVAGFTCLIYSLDRIHGALRRRILFSLLVSMIVVALGVATAILVARQLVRPIQDLAVTATAIADGDLTRRASGQGVGEIGRLARAFNHMAHRLQESYSSIERKVRERTAELERANRAKTDFLANMSHEIRTPMTAILGFAENLLDAELTEAERMDAVHTIRRNGEYLSSIIDDIVDISKIEAGKLTVERIACAPREIIAQVASMLRPRAGTKGLDLSVTYHGPIPETIQTDPTRLRQILINLVGNAVKFTEQGSVRVTVRCPAPGAAAAEHSEPRLEIDVTDTGPGLTADQIAKVFKPFTQADETMTRRFGGTGLGLSISKRLAELLGGDVGVESTPGRGSTFHLTLATGSLEGVRMVENLSEIEAPDAKSAAPNSTSPALNARLLLVEDGPDNQRLISFILTRAGAEVTVADNGEIGANKALAAWEAGTPFDVILMDMQMPVMDGYQATGLLRQRGYTGPIVALTAHAMSGDRERCLNAGCDDYLSKPVNRATLLKRVRALLAAQEATVT